MSVNKYVASQDLLVQIAGSGSEGSFHRTSPVQALAGATSVTITDSMIHVTSLINPYADNGTNEPIAWKTMSKSEGSCVITFDALEYDTNFELVVLADSLTEDAYLNDLDDVTISSVSDGQILAYDGTTQKWVNINYSGGGLKPHLVISTDTGLTVTATKGTTVVTATETSTGVYECDVDEFGTYTLSDTENTKDVVIDTVTIYQISMTPPVPEGATVTPTDDINTWIKCAGLENTNNYSTLAEVLADTDLFDTLLRDSNACDYMARSTTWAVAEGKIPTMTSNTTPSGVASASAFYTTGYEAYRAFDKNSGTEWNSNGNEASSYLEYEFPASQSIKRVSVVDFADGYSHSTSTTAKIQAYDGANWINISDAFGSSGSFSGIIYLNDTNSYTKFRMQQVSGSKGMSVKELQFYAEDDVTSNADAMTRIGKYDYCADKLSSNSTWAQAIADSSYTESVWDVSVPKMTSNTTPSGVCSCGCDSTYSGYEYNNFDGGATLGTYTQNGTYIAPTYEFPNKVTVKKASFYNCTNTNVLYSTYKLQGSDDKSTWTDLTSATPISETGAGGKTEIDVLDNNTSYKAYRIVFSGKYGGKAYIGACQVQFYGRTDSTVYSPLVPVMTSNTTPSGVASAISQYSADYAPWKAFNSSESYGWVSRSSTRIYSVDDWLEYEFPSDVLVCKARIGYINTSSANAVKYKIQKYVGTSWVDVCEEQTVSFTSSTTTWNEIIFDEPCVSKKLRLLITDSGTSNTGQGFKAQFYQAIPSTTKVHSCPNDTLYITDGVDTEVLCTTDSNGIGSIDWSDFETGTYAIYSSVAKDPTNTSKDYHKNVYVTSTSYGHTTDAYIMPDAIKTLYWYGYGSDNIELGYESSGQMGTLTKNTNNISIVGKNSAFANAIVTKDLQTISESSLKAIVTQTCPTAKLGVWNSKNTYEWTGATNVNVGVTTNDISSKIGQSLYACIGIQEGASKGVIMSAMWFE